MSPPSKLLMKLDFWRNLRHGATRSKKATIRGVCVCLGVCVSVWGGGVTAGEVRYHTLEASSSEFFSLWTKLELEMSCGVFVASGFAAAPVRCCVHLLSGGSRTFNRSRVVFRVRVAQILFPNSIRFLKIVELEEQLLQLRGLKK